MISVQEAESTILETIGSIEAETVPLADAAGRILREPILADRALPPFNRVTLDGIAIASSTYHMGKKAFKVAGLAAAGTPQQTLDNPNSCLEVMTGAAMPSGADCIVRYEDVDLDDPKTAKLPAGLNLSPGLGVHYAGSDCAAGATLLESGVVVTAKEIAIAASVGKSAVAVSRLPRIAIVTTGDELVPIDQPPEVHQIRRSNDLSLATALQRAGYPVAELVHIADDRAQIETVLRDALARFDAIVLAGGVSKGKFDFVPEILAKLGVAIRFQWVSQRPGKPMWFGHFNRERERLPVFALPGNPVSCFTCLRRYVVPALDKWVGKPKRKSIYVKLEHDLTYKQDITLFLPVTIEPRPSGEVWAKPVLFNTSGDFISIAKTDGFIQLPKNRSTFPQGEAFPFFDWPA